MSVSTTSSSARYSIVEPHPSVPSSHYFSTGRGGAGNVTRAPSSTTPGTDATGPAARVNLTTTKHTHPRKSFVAGRGGAGNVHPSSERAIFSFDEELERQLSQDRHAAPVYHVGRGGAGNLAGGSSNRTSSSSSSSAGPSQKVWLDGSVSGGNYGPSSTRRRSSDQSFTSHSSTGSESGADAFNRGVKKRWNKLIGVGYYMTG
ncbi:hypothetical protein LTR99_006002 [Exophiala xenobiotica]|uniref:Uncharacterized protein n=1 Tax=Vermiconidia calcicola TaxID=1690605 RepID=A0AAV9QG00_9PEZI|nr:hypothetical protein LTR72_005827 [Exophiala xenobiotica]KAK5540926.1 hypothetical protein LTR25_002703 [Vermiconidia calcicola]KAK5549583.1 hypothetical protein LTR23_000691 [Chaetothyriales sp. CCFEE 6169]KAK5267039.1 hypothetical protein LTR96_007706 [Exophiala xenobiotica]KAK5297191.1 hypothetical protein LTR14_002922 [Exophiala xenobiotica]